jgi:hypothetical protein
VNKKKIMQNERPDPHDPFLSKGLDVPSFVVKTQTPK